MNTTDASSPSPDSSSSPTELAQSIRVDLTSIKVGDRVRVELGDMETFAESIREVGGLIHPIAVNEKMELVAGGRRFTAYTYLHQKYPTEGWNSIPVTLADTDGSMTKLRMLELEENFRRKEMTWKERVRSIVEIHNLQSRESYIKGEKWAGRHTAALLNVTHSHIYNALTVYEYLQDHKHPIQQADSINDAYRILLQLKEDEGNRIIAAQTAPAPLSKTQSQDVQDLLSSLPDLDPEPPSPDPDYKADNCIACSGTGVNSKGEVCPICKGVKGVSFVAETITLPLSQMFHFGDSIEWCKARGSDSIDTICTDPPYAIDMGNLQQENTGMQNIQRVIATHDVEENLDILEEFIPEAYRILKPNGFCVLWCDYMHFRFLHDCGRNAGFKVQRWPLIWTKTGPAMNQAAGFNFTKDHECAIVMRKGGTLVLPQPTSYFSCGPVDKSRFDHPFAKPPELWKWVMRAIAIPGQTILDPFCGVGSGCVAAAEIGCQPFGIEKDPLHFTKLINTMRIEYTNMMKPKKVEFK